MDTPLKNWHSLPRKVVPELLDSLPHDCAEAVRSRRDLAMINAIMGNHRCILRHCKHELSRPGSSIKQIIEIGAGDGQLSAALQRQHPQTPVSAIDLAPRPTQLDEKICWRQEDLFKAEIDSQDSLIVANLFLHHFDDDQLRGLSEKFANCSSFISVEPQRSRRAMALTNLLRLSVNQVTWHDMRVSIRAGFHRKELEKTLGSNWHKRNWNESGSFFGGLITTAQAIES